MEGGKRGCARKSKGLGGNVKKQIFYKSEASCIFGKGDFQILK